MRKFRIIGLIFGFIFILCNNNTIEQADNSKHEFNGTYQGPYLNRLAFPLGGIGAGMICLEGTGAISHVSVRNEPNIFNEPLSFSAIHIKDRENGSKVLQGPVPDWKIFGMPNTGNGAPRTSYGLPRFTNASVLARFPFAEIELSDPDIPLEIKLIGWSPFIPGDADNSSLPVAALEYHFHNPSDETIKAVFSYNTVNFMATDREGNTINPIKNGFILQQQGTKENPHHEGAFSAWVNDNNVVVDHCWFKGGWWDPLTLAWKNITEGSLRENPPVEGPCPGASLFVPFNLKPGQDKNISLLLAWYVPKTNLRIGKDPQGAPPPTDFSSNNNTTSQCCSTRRYHIPWYAEQYKSILDISGYWREHLQTLRQKSMTFRKAFYEMTLPDEVIEAVAANLTIIKSPTVRRQCDGRLWCWEGCSDARGCCFGSCTHVWNYAQAIPHLFPKLERTLRETEFNESQNPAGHQAFRTALPIRPIAHNRHAAADGQLGGIMKVYRDWRISGDTSWLEKMWPEIKISLDYCIETWDPRHRGVLEEPHHNTYDIEYWGPDGHCSSFYLGALNATVIMGKTMNDDISKYKDLLDKGKIYLETKLYNGEYFYQKVMTDGLDAQFDPLGNSDNGKGYQDVIQSLNEQGPKYQYGTGCLSDGVLGFWLAHMCGLDGNIVHQDKIKNHLESVFQYNLKKDLTDHANPQRPAFAMGQEGGLLLCTWPHGGKPLLPFVYSDEVWTGIEYQVASHLMIQGQVQKGLEIVRTCRDRYNGSRRNPFNEYECGHWYARAMASYGLLQGLTGVRYDAVTKTLYIDSRIGDNFKTFLATETGFGVTGLDSGTPFMDVRQGEIDIERVVVSGEELNLATLKQISGKDTP
jgi:uncharacterized protein (DUF608 family)